MTHEMGLQPIYFDLIKNGTKIYEVRLNDEKRQKIEPGDFIVFTKSKQDEKILTTVEDLIYFKSFNEMAKALPADKIEFKGIKPEDLVKTFYQFYSKALEEKYGVVAIKLKVVKI